MVHLVLQDLLDQLVQQVHQAMLETLEQLDRRDKLDTLVPQDLKGTEEMWELLEFQETLAHLERLETQVPLVQLV